MHRKKEPVLPDTTCDLQLAEKFSQFYSDKIIKIREDIDKQDVIQTTYIQSKPTSPTPGLMDFVPTSVAEVRRIIMSSPTSSCELDPIPTGLVKEHVDDFAPYITGIVNKSLRDATFPDSMQYALVKPLLKQSHLDPQNLASYRPVANLTFLSKVAERVVSIRLQKYLNENGLQDSFQSAYREMHSVETALLRVQNDILTEMDKGNVVGLILLDLSGAFDTVDHNILEDRLQLTGIGGKALLWFISYLSHRSQAVCVRSSTSKATTV